MLNLKTLFGSKYRIQQEQGSKLTDPAAWLVPAKHGHFYSAGKALIGVSTNTRGGIARQIAKLAGVTVVQDGDDGINAVFAPDIFATVARIMRPKRRKVLSDAQRAALAAGSRPFASVDKRRYKRPKLVAAAV